MAVRRQRATTTKEIMSMDIKTVIEKAKRRYRTEGVFFILRYYVSENYVYFASSYPDGYPIKEMERFYEMWVFDNARRRWVLKIRNE